MIGNKVKTNSRKKGLRASPASLLVRLSDLKQKTQNRASFGPSKTMEAPVCGVSAQGCTYSPWPGFEPYLFIFNRKYIDCILFNQNYIDYSNNTLDLVRSTTYYGVVFYYIYTYIQQTFYIIILEASKFKSSTQYYVLRSNSNIFLEGLYDKSS